MKNQTKIIVGVLFLVLIIILFGQSFIKKEEISNISIPGQNTAYTPETAGETSPSPTINENALTVSIDFGDGNKITEKVEAQTPYDALKKAAQIKEYPVETKEYKYGLMVEKIGTKANTGGFFWTYSVNGKAGQVAADRYVISPGDTVEWVYKK